MSGGTGKGHTDVTHERETKPATMDSTVHDLRNALAGVRGAVQIVRERLAGGMEREILGEVLARVDQMDELVLRLATERARISEP